MRAPWHRPLEHTPPLRAEHGRWHRLQLTLTIFILFHPFIHSQDIHFSQYFNAPMALGPGNIGVFEGDHRVHGIFRQQWRAVTTPYRTFGLGGDSRTMVGVDRLAVGFWLFNDRAGDSRLNQFHVSAGASWTERFGAGNDQRIVLGIQAGLTSLTLDASGQSFDAQYNGFYYDPNLATGEQYSRDGLIHPDLHAGITYRYSPASRELLEVGFNWFNLTRPRIGLLLSPEVPLDRRASFHARGQRPISASLDILPMIRYQMQGTFEEMAFGANLRHIMLDRYGLLRAVQFGLHYRAADAGYAYLGLEYDDWTFGMSYDLNVSDLVPASRNRGAIEFSVIRILRTHPSVPVRFRECPAQL